MNIRKITKRFRKEINEKELLLTCLTSRNSSGTAIQVLVEQVYKYKNIYLHKKPHYSNKAIVGYLI
jgi:hypothetical protein